MTLNQKLIQFINKLRKKEFAPYYLYDSEVIREHCRIFQGLSYPNKSIHFASMANINPQFLKIAKDEKLNVFVNSIQHLKKVQQSGFSRSQIIYTASALTEKTMRYAHKQGVQVNLDSTSQLDQWLRLHPSTPVGIRCNIGDHVVPQATHAGYFIGKESRLGMTTEDLAKIKDKSMIKGLHLYIGTDLFDLDYFLKGYGELAKIATHFPRIEYLNFGGGFGVAENGEQLFDFERYNVEVTKLMESFSKSVGRSIQLVLEPGRIIGGSAGFFVCHVTDIKPRESMHWVGVNASTVQFTRPLLYPETAKHPVAILRNGKLLPSASPKQTTIYGCSTYSRDLFSKNIPLPEIAMGDILVFGNAGSYSASSHIQFLGFPKPKEYFL